MKRAVHYILMFCSSYIPLFLLMILKNVSERLFQDSDTVIGLNNVREEFLKNLNNITPFVYLTDYVIIGSVK